LLLIAALMRASAAVPNTSMTTLHGIPMCS